MTLVFCIHYFLWYGALTSIFGYESVFARHYTQASAAEYGILNMLLPFVTVLVTPVVCSMADRYRSHRSYFTISLMMTMISFSLHSLLPLLLPDRPRYPAPGGNLLIGPWIYYCLICLLSNISMGINTCLSDSFAVLQAEEQGTSFGRIIVWGTYGWALSALIQGFVNQITFLPRLVPGLLVGTVLLTIDVVMVSLWRKNSDFKLDTIPIKAAQTLTSSSSSLHREPSDYQPQNESALINLGMEPEGSKGVLKRQTKSPVKIMLENEQQQQQQEQQKQQQQQKLQQQQLESKTPSPTIISLNSDASDFSGSSTVTNIGEIGELGGGGYNLNNKNQPQKLDNKETIILKNIADDELPEKCTSFKLQLVMLRFILSRRQNLVRYLILFILSGFFMSMHWNYFFLFLEELHGNKFEIISAFSMICQSIIGELPFFILSRKLIDFFGRSHTLSFIFISMGLRFLLYAYFLPNVSPYLVIVADCLQGPNYGLFYVVMTEVGLEFSYCDDDTIEMLNSRGDIDASDKRQVDSVRLLLKSTIQSVAFACYEGIGLGLGSIVGGFILVNLKFETLWLIMAAGAFFVGFINTLIEYTCHGDHGEEEERSDRREFIEAKAKGLIERVASPAPLHPNQADSTSDQQPTDNQQMHDLDQKLTARKRTRGIARKSAGGPIAPPAAILSYVRAREQPARRRRRRRSPLKKMIAADP